ncbi:MAG: hypothetical protein QOC61_1994 [Acidobacteriota bacterium]|jgi:hypothetical protein|nr:hypothetical protein [Acidobacteriota bacterium]
MSTVNVACPACQTANPNAEVNSMCAACGEPLAATLLQHNLDELKRLNERMSELNAKSFKSFNGFGTTLLDYRESEGGTWEATRWVIALGLPLVPLSTYIIRPKRQENSYGQMSSYFQVIGKQPTPAARVLRVYALMLVGLTPIVLGSLNSAWVNHTLGGPYAVLAMLASFAWAVYIIFFRIKNDSKAYKAETKAETA